MLSDDFRRIFDGAGKKIKDVVAPPGLELADVAWPLISAHVADVASELRRAADSGTIAEIERPAILNRLAYNLYMLVFGATSRAMVVEMAAAESTGLMRGDTPEGRYAFFADMLLDTSFSLDVLDQYPVLKKQLLSTCRNWKEATVELIRRLAIDQELIGKSFFREARPGKVVELEMSAGDAHKRGRSTCIIRFASGARLVYKPRALRVDMHFRAFAKWVNRGLGKEQILVPLTVDRGDYGWSAFMTHEPVDDEQDLGTYYERLGAVLALAYLTGLSDLHAENIIAHGAWPVLVDLETLFRPDFNDGATEGAARESIRLLDQSVLATQLLGARASNDDDERMVDVGGIVDLAGQTTVFKVPIWRDLGRVDARLDHAFHPLVPSGNVPVLGGSRVSADLYADEIAGGFTEAYRFLQANRSELRQRESYLEAFREDPTRIVLRPTSFYARLVAASFHPDFLRESRRKDEFFESYLKDETSEPINHGDFVAAELLDLWQCDIPYFSTRAGGRYLVSSRGETLKLRPEVTGLDLALRRLDNLDEADLARQCWLIRLMLAKADNRAAPKPFPLARRIDPFDLEEAARAVAHAAAEAVCSNAIFDGYRRRATWHTVGEASGVATVNNADLDLYSGLPGIALFLSLAGRLLDEPAYRAVAQCALNEILARADGPDATLVDVGGYFGSGGLAYALLQMAADFPDLNLGRRAAEILLAADHEAGHEIDLVYGLAGALMSCITVYRHSRAGSEDDRATRGLLLDRALRIGRLISDRLEQDERTKGLGESFAHGRAGVAAALVRLFAETGDRDIGKLARLLLNETAGVVTTKAFDVSWCRGQSGLILALAEGADHLEDRRVLAGALDELAARAKPKDHSLCHGAMGVASTLQATWALTEPDENPGSPVIARLVRDISETGLLCGTIGSVVSPGLMDGLAGIGLGALGILYPLAVPSILSLAGVSANGKRR